MSMHLVGPYLTTTNYKKRKVKLTRVKRTELDQRWRERNKFLKSMGLPTETFEQFMDYVHGKRIKDKRQVVKPLKNTGPTHRETKQFPSLPMSTKDMQNACAKREPKVYSGERQLLGIATMHKSNMVPVFADCKETAVEIAQMRR